jgi:NADP-dependent 3-hydroxy acid dehydrogenase YdfG
MTSVRLCSYLLAAQRCGGIIAEMSASTALVTGASGGIGLHIARQLAEQGWTVLVGARDAARGAEVAAQVGARPVLLDVTDANAIATAAATTPELDVLVNNAGISLDTGALVTETDVEVFRRTYETNIFGVVAPRSAVEAKGARDSPADRLRGTRRRGWPAGRQ